MHRVKGLKDVYRILMIGFGAGLITLGFVGIALSNRAEVQRREDWVLVAQRAGASVASFTVNLSIGRHNLRVWLWVHNYSEGFYVGSDTNGNQIFILNLATAEQLNEWEVSDTYFQIFDPGYHTFELFNATFSRIHSNAKLYQHTDVNEYLYPYQSLFWVGAVFLVIGVPLVVVGSASSLTHRP